jgi:hypothetical protein
MSSPEYMGSAGRPVLALHSKAQAGAH